MASQSASGVYSAFPFPAEVYSLESYTSSNETGKLLGGRKCLVRSGAENAPIHFFAALS